MEKSISYILMKNRLAGITFALLLFVPLTCFGAKEKKNVLYLNSYHHGYQWSDEILEGIREVLARSDYKVDLQVEYIDSKKYKYEHINNSLFKLYQEKFVDEDFDIIIVSDNHAYNFVIEHRAVLFPGVPLVFCGMNNFESADTSTGNLTGIVESFDLLRTLSVARTLHPEKNKMVVVGDQSITGRSIEKQVYTMLEKYQGDLEVEYWSKLSLDETKERVEKLPENTFLFFIPWYQTVKGKFYTAEEVMEAIYDHSSVPIYTCWEFLLGHGTVGGSLISGTHHGKMTANVALRILSGENPEDIAVVAEPTGDYKFDYQVMKKLKINQKLLPDGAVIINSPKAFYELKKELLWTIITSFLLLVVVLIILVFTMLERRKVQRKVLEQLSFQETLMDTIPQLVSWKDIGGKYLGANRTFTDFFGIDSPDGVVSKSTKDVVDDNDYVKWSVDADNAVVGKQKEFRKLRKKIIDHSGNVGWLEVNKVPLRDQTGRTIGILTTAENVTKEHNLENQLLQSQKMEAIGTLAGGIAHDFNNILTSIINSTELAIGDVLPESQTKKDLERVVKAARRGSRVVKQILAFSRPTQDDFRSTDLGAVISEVTNLMEVSLPSNIIVRSHIPPKISNIHADPTQLHQAVMNLCTNGFHALRDKGGELQLRVEEVELDLDDAAYMDLQPGSFIVLTVADNGSGINPEDFDKIFDPFFSSKDKSEGTGLGLAVVHGIVKGHGGAIKVQSEVGMGTVFEVFLPKIDSPGSSYELDKEIVTESKGRILFVEDDVDQLLTAPRLLRGFGYEVESVDAGKDAAALIAANPKDFDLLITDYDMPGLNGVQLVAAMSDSAPELPVIMISGREEAITASSRHHAIKKVLIKPYDKDELRVVIHSILNRTIQS